MRSGQQLIGDTGEPKYVVARIRILPLDHLGAGVGGSERSQRMHVECSTVGCLHTALRDRPRNSEVDPLHSTSAQDQYVRRFQVGMYDPLGMRELQCGRDL